MGLYLLHFFIMGLYIYIFLLCFFFLGFLRGHRCTVSTFVFTHLNISCKARHKLHNNK